MATKRDYYEVLGINKSASADEIKKAYNQKVKEFHPDLHPEMKDAKEKTKEVNEAFEVLGDKEKKQKYDSFGHAGVNGDYGGGYGNYGANSYYTSNVNVEDIFSNMGSIFEDFFGVSSTSARTRTTRDPKAPRNGEDRHEKVSLSFKEAVKGVTKRITFLRLNTCDLCHGVGALDPKDVKTCATCNGSGIVSSVQASPFGGSRTVQTICGTCNGTGEVIKNPCSKCGGQKRVTVSESVDVNIPKGVDNDMSYRVDAKGDAGINGGGYGDLIIEIIVKPDPIFVRDRNNIYCEMPITFAQAALGDTVEVPTIDGKVKYKIPAGTQNGTTFRFDNKGVKTVGTRSKGDQFVKVHVEIPTNLNSQQKKAIKELETILDENNSKHYNKRKGFFDKLKDWGDK